MTPICPRSLSFRPVLLPPSADIQLHIGESSRSQVEVSMDGQEIFLLDKKEYLRVNDTGRKRKMWADNVTGQDVQISYSMCDACE